MGKKRSGITTLLAGITIGAGLGVLFAPKSGKETRADLKKKFDKVVEDVKEIDAEDVKQRILTSIDEIKQELSDLDKEKALDLAKSKAVTIQKKCEELYNLAKEKGTPVLQKSVSELKDTTVDVLKKIVDKLEEKPEVETKKIKKTS